MKINRDLIKAIIGAVVQYGSGTIVYGIIEKHVEPERVDKKVAVAAASMALGGVVGNAAADYTNRLIDDVFDKIEEIKKNKTQP